MRYQQQLNTIYKEKEDDYDKLKYFSHKRLVDIADQNTKRLRGITPGFNAERYFEKRLPVKDDGWEDCDF